MFASLQDGAGTQPLGEGLEAAVAGQRIGYLRVSTLDQNEKRQLEGQVLDWVFTDKASAGTPPGRITELLRFARDGETVVVHSMDRLARNLDDYGLSSKVLPGRACGGSSSKRASSSRERTPPWSTSALRHGFLRRIRTLPRQRTPKGRRRPCQAARRLQRPEKDPHTGTGRRTGPARRQRSTENLTCP